MTQNLIPIFQSKNSLNVPDIYFLRSSIKRIRRMNKLYGIPMRNKRMKKNAG